MTHTSPKRPFLADFKKCTHTPPPQGTISFRNAPKRSKKRKKGQFAPCSHIPAVTNRNGAGVFPSPASSGFLKSRVWFLALWPMGGQYILTSEMRRFIPDLSEAPHSLVCEDVCPYLVAYREQYKRMLSEESFVACENYVKKHKLRLPQ